MVKQTMKSENLIYIFRLLGMLIITVIMRCLFSKTNQEFYDYISYVFSIGILLLILLPNLHEFKFWGISAKGNNQQIDDTTKIILVNENGK
ncbi:hypothetical protein JXA48_01720 [Candidatus Woesearchaeota archaeon]|nr:hypothetical protein [Candidatus Woesearchaeota archaeon]